MSASMPESSETDLAALQQRLFQVAFMLVKDFSSAEDIAQEAIARVVEHRGSYRGEGDFSSWAYAITINLCRAKKQADRKRPKLMEQRLLEQTPLKNPRHGVSTSFILHETYELASVAVRGLPPNLREVFVLHYIEGLPYAAVATIMGISQGAARLRAKRARESLEANLAAYLPPAARKAIQDEASLPPRSRKA